MSTTTTEPVKKERKPRKQSEWTVLAGHDLEWRVAGTVKAPSRKAAITSVITNEKADAGANPAPRRSYVAVLSEDWQPLKPTVEQPPPVITLEAAK